MVETTSFLKAILEVINVNTRTAWLLTMLGASLLAMPYVLPSLRTDSIAPTVGFAFIMLCGILNLFMDLAEHIVGRIKARGVARADAAKAAEIAAWEEKNIEANMATLNEREERQLIWIFIAGHQRVDLPVMQSLVGKRMVRMVGGLGTSLYEVDDKIWAHRQEFMANNPNARNTEPFPVVYSPHSWMGR
jgi:hypothetical protein